MRFRKIFFTARQIFPPNFNPEWAKHGFLQTRVAGNINRRLSWKFLKRFVPERNFKTCAVTKLTQNQKRAKFELNLDLTTRTRSFSRYEHVLHKQLETSQENTLTTTKKMSKTQRHLHTPCVTQPKIASNITFPSHHSFPDNSYMINSSYNSKTNCFSEKHFWCS